MVATVNGLPDSYRGSCNIILNDLDPYVFSRNVLVLIILLDKSIPLDEAVEMAVDLSYSVRLSKATASQIDAAAKKILAPLDERIVPPLYAHSFSVRGGCGLEVRASNDTFGYLARRMHSNVPRDVLAAEKSMHAVVSDPSRQDYRDRYFLDLKPSHRVAASVYRKNGMVRPIGTHMDDFDQPNR